MIVSIGIMLAFGINKCSSDLAESREAQEYKTSLIADLNENLKSITRIIRLQERKVLELNSVLKTLDDTQANIDSIGSILYRQRKSPTFFPISGTFKSLVSQGEIGILNTELKRELFNLYDTQYNRSEYNGELYDKIYVDLYDKEIGNVIDFSSHQITNPTRLATPEFRKCLLTIVDEAKSYISLMEMCKAESEGVLQLLK